MYIFRFFYVKKMIAHTHNIYIIIYLFLKIFLCKKLLHTILINFTHYALSFFQSDIMVLIVIIIIIVIIITIKTII